MKKKTLYILLAIIILCSLVYSETSSSSINWASTEWVKSNFCMLGGNCNISSLNAINVTTTNYNVTDQICLSGDCIDSWSNTTADFMLRNGTNSADTVYLKNVSLSKVSMSQNSSYGITFNDTDMIIGYIGGLS